MVIGKNIKNNIQHHILDLKYKSMLNKLMSDDLYTSLFFIVRQPTYMETDNLKVLLHRLINS